MDAPERIRALAFCTNRVISNVIVDFTAQEGAIPRTEGESPSPCTRRRLRMDQRRRERRRTGYSDSHRKPCSEDAEEHTRSARTGRVP